MTGSGTWAEQVRRLIKLVRLLHDDEWLDESEETALRPNILIPEKGNPYLICEFHRVLGKIDRIKGETHPGEVICR